MTREPFKVSELEINFGLRRNQKELKKFVSNYINEIMPNAKFKMSSRFFDPDAYGEDLLIKVKFNPKVEYSEIINLLHHMFQDGNLIIKYRKKTYYVEVTFGYD